MSLTQGFDSGYVDPGDETGSPATQPSPDLASRYRDKSSECKKLKKELEETQRKAEELTSQLREKEVIVEYLEKKIFDQKCSAGFEPPATPGLKMFAPSVSPIYPAFPRPVYHFQQMTGAPRTSTPVNGFGLATLARNSGPLLLSPSKYRLPQYARPTSRSEEDSLQGREERRVEPIDCRKRKGAPTDGPQKATAPVMIEEMFPELSGMCKPYVRICVTGGTKSFFCIHPNCNGRELNGNVWRKHYTSHFPDSDCRSPYHCPKCSQGFDLYRPLSKHYPTCGVTESPN